MTPSKTIPEGLCLPPFPPVPAGYSHWEYLGQGGDLYLLGVLAGCYFKGDADWEPGIEYSGSATCAHYIRAVPIDDANVAPPQPDKEEHSQEIASLNAKLATVSRELEQLKKLGETENTVTPGFWGRVAATTARERDEARAALTDLVLLCDGLADSGYVHKDSQQPIEWSPDGPLARAKALLLR